MSPHVVDFDELHVEESEKTTQQTINYGMTCQGRPFTRDRVHRHRRECECIAGVDSRA